MPTIPTPMSFYVTDGWEIKYGKAFTLRFVLDTLKSSKFLSRQRQGNGRCPTGMILSHYFCTMQKVCCVFISAWASALLVSTGWAMLEPQSVGRVTSQTPTLFRILCHIIIIMPIWGVLGA